MAIIKFINNKRTLKQTIDYVIQDKKTNVNLIGGKDCMPETAYKEMMLTKKQFNKIKGRDKIHFIQSFSPSDNIDYRTANDIASEIAKEFKGFQVLYATHQDKDHIHTHFVINTVNFENGKKFEQSPKDLEHLKEVSNSICVKYGLTTINKKSKVEDIKINEYKCREKDYSWKKKLQNDIDKAMNLSINKKEFFNQMNKMGYKVTWTKERKNITYTTPEGMKCRDRKLHDEKYLKENMEKYFKIKRIVQNEKIKKDNKIKKYKVKAMSSDIAFIIGQFKSNNNLDYQVSNYSNGTNAKKEYLRKINYSSEELNM